MEELLLQDEVMDEGDTDDHNDGHDDGGPLREATPTHRCVRGYGSYRLRPYVREALHAVI